MIHGMSVFGVTLVSVGSLVTTVVVGLVMETVVRLGIARDVLALRHHSCW